MKTYVVAEIASNWEGKADTFFPKIKQSEWSILSKKNYPAEKEIPE